LGKIVYNQGGEFQMSKQERFVILGGGTAGYHTAVEIRNRNKIASITIVSEEAKLPYFRTMLTKAILADQIDERITISPEKWYQENQIEVMLETKALAINTNNKTVSIKTIDGVKKNLHYDKLIYALGGFSFVPPIKGADNADIVAIRNVNDIDKLRKILKEATEAVVIGGGVLGLEAACQLIKANLKVTVIENQERLLPRQLDIESSEKLAKALESKGLSFITNGAVTQITNQSVELADERVLPANLVIISTGVHPNLEIAKTAGLEIDRSIIVDNHMRTSIPDIYACGDCASFQGVNYSLWPEATAMGKVAGANAAGEEVEYKSETYPLMFIEPGISLYVAGDTGVEPLEDRRIIEINHEEKGIVEKLFFHKDILVGVVVLGSLSKGKNWFEKIKGKMTYQEFLG
jgi:NAD(P)H-nitrite reductase large subunit